MINTQLNCIKSNNTLDFFDFELASFKDKYLKDAIDYIKALRSLVMPKNNKLKCVIGFSAIDPYKSQYQNDLKHSKFVITFYREYQRGLAVQTFCLTKNQLEAKSNQELAEYILRNYVLWIKKRITHMRNASKSLDFKTLTSSIVPNSFKKKRRTYVMSGVYIDDVFTRKSLITLIVNNLGKYASDGEYWHQGVPSRYYYLELLLADEKIYDLFLALIVASGNVNKWTNNLAVFQLLSIILANAKYNATVNENTIYYQLLKCQKQFDHQLSQEAIKSLKIINERITDN